MSSILSPVSLAKILARRQRRGFGGGWPAGWRSEEKRARGRVVGLVRALECRSEGLGRSARRLISGAHGRNEVVSSYDKKVYIASIQQAPARRVFRIAKERPFILKEENIERICTQAILAMRVHG